MNSKKISDIHSIDITNNNPRIPSYLNIREYQKDAMKMWIKNDCMGILEMATGERVIIVMGALNLILSRVSGTLTKYYSYIA